MQSILLPLAMLLIFISAVVAAQILASQFLAARERDRLVKRRLDERPATEGRATPGVLIEKSTIRGLRGAIAVDILKRGEVFLGQSGLGVSPARLLTYWVAGGAALWAVSFIAASAFGVDYGLAELLASVAGAALLTGLGLGLWVSRARKGRMKTLEEQLPLALDVVIRAIRAGHPVISAVQLVTREMPDPIAAEFSQIVDETTYGLEFSEALRNFARRTGSEDAHFFAVSVSVQSETGGNLAEILNNLATVVRSRLTLAKRVKALASEGRMSALVLSVLPVFLVGFVALTQPTFYVSKFSDPIFWPVVAGIVVLYAIGQVIMNRIVNFKY